MQTPDIQNVIIIGSGPAALTAAIYISRAQLQPILIQGEKPGGQLMGTSVVENWPGSIEILGPDLMSTMMQQAKLTGTTFIAGSVQQIQASDNGYIVTTNVNTQYQGHAILIATGTNPQRLGCPGEDQYWGKGITTCAVCDGALYKDKTVIVIGGGDSGAENALFLTKFTKKVSLIQNKSELTASTILAQRVLNNPNIHIIYNSTVTAFSGDGQRVTTAIIKNTTTEEKEDINIDGAFLAIGLIPNSDFIKGFVKTDQWGYILIDKHFQTSKKGIFAAGDIHDSRYKQAVTAAGDGCKAALEIERYLEHLNNSE